MARKMTPETISRDHNSKDVKRTIKEAADKIIRLKAERSEVQAQITKVRAEVKSLGIKAVDFNAALRLYELDHEDRNESIDNIRIAFDALGIGGQGNMFPETEPS